MEIAKSECSLLHVSGSLASKALACSIKEQPAVILIIKLNKGKYEMVPGSKIDLANFIFDQHNNLVDFQKDELSYSDLSPKNTYCSTIAFLKPGQYKCRTVIQNPQTGLTEISSSSVFIRNQSQSKIQIDTPLILVQKRDPFYLDGFLSRHESSRNGAWILAHTYPFNFSSYAPLVDALPSGTTEFCVLARYFNNEDDRTKTGLSGYLVNQTSGKKEKLDPELLKTYLYDGIQFSLIKFRSKELQTGHYILYVFARNTTSKDCSYATIEINVQ
jgi:hypothetical protein